MFPVVLIQLVVALAVVGLILWAITQIPMDPTISKIIRVIVIFVVVIWLLYVLMGFVGGVPMFPAIRR